MPAIDEDLCLPADLHDSRRAPGRHILTRCAPEFFTVGQVKNCEKRVGLHIAEHDDFTVMNDGRTGEAPLRAGDLVVTGVHRTQVLFPQ